MIERLQRVVLAFVPREFRERFGAEMLQTARAIDAERPRHPVRWAGALIDALLTPVSVRRDLRREARRLEPPDRRTIPMESLLRDAQFAVRALRRERSFTAFCLVTLALGIGANAAMFGIADRLLLAGPDHVRDADRVVRVYATTHPAGQREFTTSGFGFVSYDLLRQGSQTFSDVATYAINDAVEGGGSEARKVRVGYATSDLFPLLGVQPARGRFFDAGEDASSGAARVAVLSEAAWRAWLGAGDDALGKTVVLNDEPFTVIGVAPHGFTGPQFDRVDAWVPGSLLGARVTPNWTTAWNAQWLQIVGRLKPDVTFEQAGQDATAVHRRGYTGSEDSDKQAQFTVASLRANESGAESTDLRVLRWLTGVSALVLLIACANIANLLLARGLRRAREVAVRAALGAGRLRLIRLLLIESVLLAIGGATLGLVIAWWVGTAARNILFTSVEWTSPPVNLRILLVSIAMAVFTGLVMGLVPAIRATRNAGLSDALKTGVREGGGHRSRLRSSLTVVQAALSVVLLVGAGLFVHSLWKAYTIDFGFDPDRVTVIEVARRNLNQVAAGPARDAERARRRAFYFDVLERVRTLAGVEHASIATGMPFGNRFSINVRASDGEIPRLPGGGPGLSAVTRDYFETMGTTVVRGRAFTDQDGAGTEPIAIVSQLMADRTWPGGDPIGKCLFLSNGPATQAPTPACSRIVGIAENTYRSRLREDPVMHYYIPEGQEAALGFGGAALLVRSSDASGNAVTAVRQLLSGLDGTITFVNAETVRARIDPQMRPWKLGATVFAVSGLLALVVAAIGIYSVMSYLIADRRHEIGVRLALGARTSDIVRLIFGGSVTMAVMGVIIGEAIALSLGGLVAPLLFATSPRQPAVFAVVGGVLIAVALLATAGPARRARGVSAMEALRAE